MRSIINVQFVCLLDIKTKCEACEIRKNCTFSWFANSLSDIFKNKKAQGRIYILCNRMYLFLIINMKIMLRMQKVLNLIPTVSE